MLVETTFARQVAASLGEVKFTALCIGANVNPVWKLFEHSLNTVAIPRVRFSENIDADGRAKSGRYWARNPWGRLAVVRSQEIKAAAAPAAQTSQSTPIEPEPAEVLIPESLYERNLTDVDFIDLQLGGADFVALTAVDRFLDDAQVLGLSMIVNFFGSADTQIHTFHNVDRSMKARGFELFLLSQRRYSMAALPTPYKFSYLGESVQGRLLQGNALYLRDWAAPENVGAAIRGGALKLAKLAAIFSMADLPDCAADLIVRTKPAIAEVLNVELALDNLTAQIARRNMPSKYSEYMQLFDADDARFYDGANH